MIQFFEPTPSDARYLHEHFRPLKDLCRIWNVPEGVARREMQDGVLPRATYTLSGNRELFPDDLFVFSLGVSPSARKRYFIERYETACIASGINSDAEDSQKAWDDYISGGYGACLRIVLPETICRKCYLISAISEAIEAPEPAYPGWLAELSRNVDALDALLRPFADIDREYAGGQVSRDVYVSQVRKMFLQTGTPRT